MVTIVSRALLMILMSILPPPKWPIDYCVSGGALNSTHSLTDVDIV